MLIEPKKILCVGLNYRSHAEETGGEAPKEPVIFSKFPDALARDGQEITLPPWHRCYDYEAELVVVMGKALYNGDEEAAKDAIGGYTCGNDLSARDCQLRSSQWLIGKTFPGFAPVGPRIVPPDRARLGIRPGEASPHQLYGQRRHRAGRRCEHHDLLLHRHRELRFQIHLLRTRRSHFHRHTERRCP